MRRRMPLTPTARLAQPTNGRVSVVRGVRRQSAKPRRASIPEAHAPEQLAWYAALAMMPLLEVIEWPVAVVIAAGHEISHRGRSRVLREFAEGIEAGG
jgi:hypothetical protein